MEDRKIKAKESKGKGEGYVEKGEGYAEKGGVKGICREGMCREGGRGEGAADAKSDFRVRKCCIYTHFFFKCWLVEPVRFGSIGF